MPFPLLSSRNQKLPFTPLFRQVLIALPMLAVFGLTLFGVSSWHQERQNLLDQLAIQSRFLASSSEAVLDNVGSSLFRIGDRLQAGHRPAQLVPLLKELQRQHPELSTIFVYAPSGKAVLAYTNQVVDSRYDISRRPLRAAEFTAGLNDPAPYYVGRTERGDVTHIWRMPIRYTLRDSGGRPLYVISASLPIARQTALWARLPLFPDEAVGLVRDDGFIQVRWPIKNPDNVYGQRGPVNGPFSRARQMHPAYGIYDGILAHAFGTRLGAYARLRHLPLTAFVSVPTTLIWQVWWAHNRPFLMVFGLSFMALFGLTWVLLKREDLKESQRQLRRLAAYQEMVREEEKKRIAMEVHDELGQVLMALKMSASWLGIQLKGENGPLELKITEMKALIDSAATTVRHIVTNLRPAILDRGLLPALCWLADDFSRHYGIPCHFQGEDMAGTLGDEQANIIFRMVQEALTNIARHAGATEVHITFERQAQWLLLTVADNGRGIDPQAMKGHTFGLLGLQERALILNGRAEITSVAGQGAQITIAIPLPRATASPTAG